MLATYRASGEYNNVVVNNSRKGCSSCSGNAEPSTGDKANGFEAFANISVGQVVDQGVRLPDLTFPRHPAD